MPEIAEVETVRNTLKERVLNKKIKDVQVLYDKIITSDLKEFKKVLKGNEFIDIKRRGKWLIFELKDHYLLSHLRMEGKYFIKNSAEEILKHEHLIISFVDHTDLRYHDTRKFGRLKLIKKEDLNNTIEIEKQGMEPMDEHISAEYLLEKFKGRRLPIKSALLDQKIISGLGNIYADEVLFASRISPLKRAEDLSKEECAKIITNAKDIILQAISLGGTTIRSYTSSLGITGHYQDYLKVHKREGYPCPKCHNPIKRIKINGRSTYFCEVCQK